MADKTITPERRQQLLDEYADINVDHEWWDSTVEDFVSVLEAFGLFVSTRPVTLNNGKTRQDPMVFFSLSYSQGDGSSFNLRSSTLHEIWECGRKTLDDPGSEYNSDPKTWTGYLEACYKLWSAINSIAPVLLPMNCELVKDMMQGATVSATSQRDSYVRVEYDYSDVDNADGFDVDNPVHMKLYKDIERFVEDSLKELIEDINAELFSSLQSEYEDLTTEESVWDTIVANELDTPGDDDDDDEELDEAA